MLGRATRLCKEIDKDVFRIYDAVGIYKTLEDYTNMKPVVVNPTFGFSHLVGELKEIDGEDRLRLQLDEIVAKIRRKLPKLTEEERNKFEYTAKGRQPEDLLALLKNENLDTAVALAEELPGLWKFLDDHKPAPRVQYVSEHEDKLIGVERGYGGAQRPEDYLESFTRFIQENLSKITALQVIVSRPKAVSYTHLTLPTIYSV